MPATVNFPSLNSMSPSAASRTKRRDLLGLGLDLVERLDDRRHADRARARAVGAHAELHLVGVAMHDRNVLDRNAEPVRHELGEGRLVALAVAVRSGEDFDRTGWIDPHFRRFPQADAAAERADRLRRRNAARFDIGGNADAAQLAVPRRLALALGEAFIVGKLHRLLERRVIVAGVVRHDHRRLMRKRPHEILAPQTPPDPDRVSRAPTSISRSTTKLASGRPAPR